MKIISAKEVKREDLGEIKDIHGRVCSVQAVDVDLHAMLTDGTEKKGTQRVLRATIDTPDLKMSIEVGQTQPDWQAQLMRIVNAHGPGERVDTETKK